MPGKGPNHSLYNITMAQRRRTNKLKRVDNSNATDFSFHKQVDIMLDGTEYTRQRHANPNKVISTTRIPDTGVSTGNSKNDGL